MSGPDGWRIVEDGPERRRLIERAVERAVSRQAAAEGRRLEIPELDRGEIRVHEEPAASLWLFRDGPRTVLGDAEAPDGGWLWQELSALAREEGWSGELMFGQHSGDDLMAALAAASHPQRVATKMQISVASVAEPVGVRLEPMDDEEYAAYRAASDLGYAQERFASAAAASLDEAISQAEEEMAQLLPDGPATDGHRLMIVHDEDGLRLGLLWVHLGDQRGFIYDIEMDEGARGRGAGTQSLRAAAEMVREERLPVLALNVFGHNDGARRLYAREGYRETEVHWSASFPQA